MKEVFGTIYNIISNDATCLIYSSAVFAETEEEALAICDKRNLGEFLHPHPFICPPVSELLKKEPENLPKILHAACFVSFLAFKSGILKTDDILNDQGILHEIAHSFHLGEPTSYNYWPTRTELIKRWSALEAKIPGLLP